MPKVSDSGGARFHLEGVYERLLAGRCWCGSPCRSDPCIGLQALTAEQRALWEWLKAQCAWEAAQDRAERLAAGEPFTVASWQVGTHRSRVRAGAPDWPAISGGASSVWVYPDDTISPAEFYGDQRGGTIERISVSSGAALPA